MIINAIRELFEHFMGLLRGISFGNVLAKPARKLSEVGLNDFSLQWWLTLYNPLFGLALILVWAVTLGLALVLWSKDQGEEVRPPNPMHPFKLLIFGLLFPLAMTLLVMLQNFSREAVNGLFDAVRDGPAGAWLDALAAVTLPLDVGWFLPAQFAAWLLGAVLDFEAYLNTNLVYVFSLLAIVAYGLKETRITVKGRTKDIGENLVRNVRSIIIGLVVALPAQIFVLRLGAIIVEAVKLPPARAALVLFFAAVAAAMPIMAILYFRYSVVMARIFGGKSSTDGRTKSEIIDSTTLKVQQEEAADRNVTVMLQKVDVPTSVAEGDTAEAPSWLQTRARQAAIGVTNASLHFGQLAPGILAATGHPTEAALAGVAVQGQRRIGEKILDKLDPERTSPNPDVARYAPIILSATGHDDAARVAEEAIKRRD